MKYLIMNNELWGHSLRTESLVAKMGLLMRMPLKRIYGLKLAARYHDIGKTQIPSEFLNKSGELSDEELAVVRSHTEVGYQLTLGQLNDELRDMIHYHHENVDGSGYYGLLANEIPLGAKIIHVCDVYDALVSDRSYKNQWSKDAALAFLVEKKGVMFDPDIVDTFVSMIMEEMRVSKAFKAS